MLVVLLLALATATVTVTLCKARVTLAVRNQLNRVSFFKEMLKCLYCTSHWVAGCLVIAANASIVPTSLGIEPRAVELLVVWLGVVGLSAPAMWMINRSHSTMKWE